MKVSGKLQSCEGFTSAKPEKHSRKPRRVLLRRSRKNPHAIQSCEGITSAKPEKPARNTFRKSPDLL
jgi:hypothetical protein